MPNSRGAGDGLRVTDRLVVLVGAPRSALAGSVVTARPAAAVRATTTAPDRLIVVVLMAASSMLGLLACMTVSNEEWLSRLAALRYRDVRSGADAVRRRAPADEVRGSLRESRDGQRGVDAQRGRDARCIGHEDAGMPA